MKMKNSPPFKKDDEEKERKSLNFKQINYFLYQKENERKKTLIEITCKQNEEEKER